MSTILVENAAIVTMDPSRRVIQQGEILIEDDRIVYAGEHRPGSRAEQNGASQAADRVIDARGKIIMPGLIQSHIHLCQALFRGSSDDMELLDWLRLRTWPLEAAHDTDSVYYSAMLGIAECLRGGVTSIIDMETVNYTESAFKAIEGCGIRAVSGKVMMDWGDDVPKELSEKSEESLTESVVLGEKWHGAADGRIRYAMTPRFAVSCSDWLLREAGQAAREHGWMIHTHCSENRGEVDIVRRERGYSNAVYLDRVGLLGPFSVLAHCVHVDDEEIRLLAQTRTNVTHCPSANLKLASGIAPVPEMLEAGINVALGSDGAGCNNNIDQFVEMRRAALIHKPRLGPTSMPAMTVLEMATLRGAAAMGMADQVGSIEAGKKADLIMLDLRKPHSYPACGVDLVSRIVYSAQACDVVMTMVNGRVLYEDGRLLTMDEDEVLTECDRAIDRIGKRAGLR